MYECYCDKCDKRVPSRIEVREEELPVKGEPTKVTCRVRICDICGNDCWDEELDSETLSAAYELYAQRHNIVSRSELKAIRDSYGLSQRSLALLLGWGEVTVHRYENGSLPDEAHNQLLHLLKYPENMRRIARMNGDRLPASSKKKLFARLEELGAENPEESKPASQPSPKLKSVDSGLKTKKFKAAARTKVNTKSARPNK